MASNGVSSHSNEVNTISNPSNNTSFFVAQIVLRCLATMLTIAAAIVMVKSGQSTLVFGIEFQAKYTYSSAFKFFVGANIAVAALSALSLIAICMIYGPKSSTKSYFSVFLHDLIAGVLLMAGCASATAIGYIGKYGQDETGWTKICDNVTKFCNFVIIALGLSYLAFLCLFLLTIIGFRRANHS